MAHLDTLAFLNLGSWREILIILAVVLVLFGGKKLPELAKGLGRGLRIFRDEIKGVKDDFESAITEESARPTLPAKDAAPAIPAQPSQTAQPQQPQTQQRQA